MVQALATAGTIDGISSLSTAVLQTEFKRAGDEIVRLIREIKPAVVVYCGVARTSNSIRFERVAKNWDGCPAMDNAGERRDGQTIDTDGLAQYAGTLPYAGIGVALAAQVIPYEFSDDAGGYVCNHVFYRAAHEIARSRAPTIYGFVHLPPIDLSSRLNLEPERLAEAMRLCLHVVALCCSGF